MRDSRSIVFLVICLAVLSVGVLNHTVAQAQGTLAAASSIVALQNQPPADNPPADNPPPSDPPSSSGSSVDVDIDAGGGSAWYTNPVWLVLGAAVVVALIALIVSGSRSSTTVVK